MVDRQLVIATSSQAVACLGERCVAANSEKLHQQRLVEREKHHHKQLWTKDSHGGPYRKAANHSNVQPQAELGYERPKSGPTTNFVGNHMTQGAIDLAQAELFTPVDPSILLLQSKACGGPHLLAVQPALAQKPLLQPLANYTWWDSNTHICISIPISAEISPDKLCLQQVQCSVQQQQLHCTTTASKAHQTIQYSLSIPRLHACVQPGQSTCVLDGQTVHLTQKTLAPSPIGSPAPLAALQSAEESTTWPLLQQCKSLPQSSTQTQQTFFKTSIQQAPSSSLISSSTSQLQPLASQTAAAAPACVSQVFIKLAKVDPRQHWETLAKPSPPGHPCKHAPPSEQSMAALRRTLIHQRQQMQALQGTPVVCTPAPNSLSADPHLPAAAPLPAVASVCKQAEDVQKCIEAAVAVDAKLRLAFNMTPAGCKSHSLPGSAYGSKATSGTDCNGAGPRIPSHVAKVMQGQAEAQERAGAYAEAIISYKGLLQGDNFGGVDDKAHIQGRTAWCLWQTGQAKAAVEELSSILDCLLSKSTAGLSQSVIKLLETALSQRASIYEHLEAYDESLQDYCQLLTLQPSHVLAQRGACRIRSLTKRF